MNDFRRMQTLLTDLNGTLKSSEKDELSRRAVAFLDDFMADGETSNRDAFYIFTGAALVVMDRYIEDEQAAEGAKILAALAQGNEPPPARPTVPRFKILGLWNQYVKAINLIRETRSVESFQAARADFYAGAAAMLGLLHETTTDPEDLRLEINRFVQQHAKSEAAKVRPL